MKKLCMFLVLLILALSMCIGIFAASGFSDVESGMWAKSYIDYMVDKSIINGYPDGTFRPDDTVTRAEYIKMLDETFGLIATKSISFSDVKSGDWFYPYISKASAQGYLLNYGTKIDPDGKLSREEAAALLTRYLALPEDEKSESSTFSDYSSINSAYRTYVLQATYAGLFNGYPDGTFGPKKTLTRAESLAILYRAAGSIYDKTTSGRDNGANTENAVITKGGVTVKNATLYGTIIISEGASSGSVTFDNCNIRGNVIIRGAAKVYFSDCDIRDITVNSLASVSNIYIEDNTEIDTATISTKASVATENGTKIRSLYVQSGAKDTVFTGTGTINYASIKASGFKSSAVPGDYDIADDITAEFNGTVYPIGSVNGFETLPTIKTEGNYDWLSAKPAVRGNLYYYYSSSSAAPTSGTAYRSNYNNTSSLLKGIIPVYATDIVEKLANEADATGYRYVMLMLSTSSTDYTPVAVERGQTATASGFSVSPTVMPNTSTTDYMYGTPSASGTLYYYYSTNSTSPTSANFSTYYELISTSLKGNFTATSGLAFTQPLKTNISSSTYPYVIVSIKSGNSYYTPYVITRNTSTASGFSVSPTVISSTSLVDYMYGTPSASGMLFYYYSSNATAPTSSNFLSYYDLVSTSLRGSFAVTSGLAFTQALKTDISSSAYPYVIVSLYSGTSNYTPYVITRNTTSSSYGFSVSPTVTTNTSLVDTMYGTTSITGSLYFYYSTSATAPTAATFSGIYDINSVSVKGNFLVYSGFSFSQDLKTNIPAASYPYVIVSIKSGNNYTTPYVITRNASSGANDAFLTIPTLSTTASNYEQVSFTPRYTGTVRYYYTNTPTVPSTADFITNYNNIYTSYKNEISVLSTTYQTHTTFSLSAVDPCGYVVCMLTSGGIDYTPVVVSRNTTNVGNGFTAAPYVYQAALDDYADFTPSVSGTLYYYYTNTAGSITSAQFNTGYSQSSSTFKNTMSVTAGNAYQYKQLGSIALTSSYSYVAFMIKTNTQDYTPVVVSRTGSVSGTGFASTPVFAANANIDTINFNSLVTGTLVYYYTNSSVAPTTVNYTGLYNAAQYKNSAGVNAGSQTLSMFAQSTVSGYSYIAIRLTSSNGINYAPILILRNNNLGSGFAEYPAFSASGEYDYVTYKTAHTGFVRFYYTTSSAVTSFSTEYDAAMYKRQENCTAGIAAGFNTFKSIDVASYGYIVFAVGDTNGNWSTPYVLTRVTSVTTSGFVGTPSTSATSSGIFLNSTSVVSGTIEYYFTNSADSVSGAAFSANKAAAQTAGAKTGSIPATINRSQSTLIATLAEAGTYQYVVIRLVYEIGSTVYYQPVVIPVATLPA